MWIKLSLLPKSSKIIKDPAIFPFFITKSTTGGYTVYKEFVDTPDKGKLMCYPSSFQHALKRVAEYLMDEKSVEEYATIKEYIKDYKAIQNKLSNLVAI